MSPSSEATFENQLVRLRGLAGDLRWAGDSRAEAFWRQINPQLWELTENPWFVLQSASPTRLRELLADDSYNQQLHALVRERREDRDEKTWFHTHPAAKSITAVVYFSMEYMLSEALPIYSGGLGNVAGDQLKAASDLGVPVTAVGLLYQQGYFRQVIDRDGNQQALYPYNDPGQMPIAPVLGPAGEPFRLEIALPGYSVWLRVWEVQVDRCKLYLLDSNDVANFPAHRGITSELYGGGTELRLQQEILLGIGGWRLLTALGLRPEVCHLNEGHAAFAVVERARDFMLRTGRHFREALTVTRAGNLFTTHTAVEAGFDRFAPEMIEHYLGRYVEKLGISVAHFLSLGRMHPDNNTEPFNMAYLAMRGSGAVNAVSRLHGQVSRRLFAPLFPRWPEGEVPVDYVTNGIHVPSWSSSATTDLWKRVRGSSAWKGAAEPSSGDLNNISDEDLWQFRNSHRSALLDFTRLRLARERAVAGLPNDGTKGVERILDPSILTLVFARRFATYKRPTLLLRDPDRLVRLLTNKDRPIQLIVAGKAHPADRPGQDMVREWMHFLQRPDVAGHVVFLSDYDMLLTEHLVQGADVWLNTPQRPWEACGTSGMKILANGGLNLSELDGWWAERYAPDFGWALGDGHEHGGDPRTDQAEVEALYDLLEREVAPAFYQRDERGLPLSWLHRIRRSMAELTPLYSADRTVREYTERFYFPAAASFNQRVPDKGIAGEEIDSWRSGLEHLWPGLRFGETTIAQQENHYLIESHVETNGIPFDSFQVEVYADNSKGPSFRKEMKHWPAGSTGIGSQLFHAEVPADRPTDHYTVRIVPHAEGLRVPLEVPFILWQR